MGINLVGVLHTTNVAFQEAAASLEFLALEALQSSEFSQYHEYNDLLGSTEGRRRLVTLVGVALQRNPLYVSVRGMDALAAPLLLLFYERENVALACLEKLLQDFQQHLFAADSASFLRRQLAASNRLLAFVDPTLALHLYRLGERNTRTPAQKRGRKSTRRGQAGVKILRPKREKRPLTSDCVRETRCSGRGDGVSPPTFVHFLTLCILHFLRVPLMSFSPGEESTAIRLLQTCFAFINIPALCAAAVALQNAVPWSLALLPSPQEVRADAEAAEKPSCGGIITTDAPAEGAQTAPTAATDRASKPPADSGKAVKRLVVETSSGEKRLEAASTDGALHPQHAHATTLVREKASEAQQFFIGDKELTRTHTSIQQQGQTQDNEGFPHCNAEKPSAVHGRASTPSSCEGDAQGASHRKHASWKSRALMRVVKGPALMLLGAPRKTTAARNLQRGGLNEGKRCCADPMEALYSSEPLVSRWWEKMTEAAFLETTSQSWNAGGTGSTPSLASEAGDFEEKALQPPCIGVDVLLQFSEESVVLDMRPRALFEVLHFNKSIHITPKDVGELICLLKEGQMSLPDPKGVHVQVQKLGSSKPLIGKMTLAGNASPLEPLQAASEASAAVGPPHSEPSEGAQWKSGLSPAASGVLQPWISPVMHRLPLIVVVGDKEDCGSGLARRLLMAGIACVCVLLGGIDALQLDAPNDFLARKYQN
ncbi:TBC domain-containing protein kinase (incomplete catalytic triad) [Cyclospora cayetanensis]|uniref:TBC domain-containing protein kinase (Incomplete catalytic triad) n=1 Tax=Cyclospora cayetanensis TaxID=88456 RepID=A0A1D3CXP8_9EIME|nr:TBC domain-containing protein kinase (incomplete catalytic triad) [Cyclospora cayetanensis]